MNRPDLRYYIDLVEQANTQLAEADTMAGFDTAPVAAAAPAAAPAVAKTGPGPRPTGFRARMTGADARWDTANAAKYNPDGTAKKAAPVMAKSDPAVLKIQQDLIAKGAVGKDGKPLKADGIMGPNTQFAQAAQTTNQAAKPAADPAAAPAAAPTAPAIANPYQGADAVKFAAMSPKDQEWLTRAGGVPDINDEFILARAPNGGKPVATVAQGAKPAPVTSAGTTQDMGDGSKMTVAPNGQVAATNDDGTPYVPGSNPNLPKNKVGESTSFQADELTRIVSLVQHR